MRDSSLLSRRLPRAAMFILLALGLASCGRSTLPVPGDGARGASVLAPYTLGSGGAGTLATTGTPRALARIQPGVSPTDLAASFQTDDLGYIPELRIVLLKSPSGMTAATFAQRLAADPRVEFAEPDQPTGCTETRQSSIAFSEGIRPWSDVADQAALARIGALDAQQWTRGAGVLVAILDTGIELDHPALSPVLALPGEEPGVTTDPGDDRAENVDSNGDGLVDGALGHGTHVAGIVHAVAPDAHLLAVRVLDSDGVGDAFALARGLVAATNRGAAVANLSLGMDQVSLAVEAGLDYARSHGVLVVGAAGNASAPAVEFPASEPTVVAVAAVDTLDMRAAFSNYGAGVGLAAPGVGILSTYVNRGYALWSGTSMATPFVSGVGALIYALSGPRSADVATAVTGVVKDGAQPLAASDPNFAALLGAGRVSAAGSVALEERTLAGGETFVDPIVRRAAP